MNALLELRQQRAKVLTDIGGITEKVAAEKRAMSAEELTQFDKLADEEKRLRDSITRVESSEQLRKEIEADKEEREKEGKKEDQGTEALNNAYRSYLRFGRNGLNPEERALVDKQIRSAAGLATEFRDQGVGTVAAGGATVPQDFSNELAKAMKFFGGMRQVARTITTVTGAPLPWPTVNDTGNVGAILGENSADTTQDATFAQLNLGAYMYTSKIVKVSLQLLQDSAFDVQGFLRDILSERVGRITNTHFTVGDGTNKPRGVVTDAALGKVGANGQTTSVTYNDLVDLKYSVNRVYRAKAAFQMADSTWKAVLKLVDSEGRPLVNPNSAGITTEADEQLLNQGVIINDDVPVMAASAKSILYGDFRNYVIRDVRDMTLVRMDERFADALQVGFILFYRGDGRLIDAGTNPVRYYQNSAT